MKLEIAFTPYESLKMATSYHCGFKVYTSRNLCRFCCKQNRLSSIATNRGLQNTENNKFLSFENFDKSME